MEDKPLQEADLEKATSRRSRKDEEGRDYICGCGKKYLSYPALYTHIKTKHEGRQPEGTLKTGVNMVIKRGKLKFQEETLKHIYSFFGKEDLRVLSELDEICTGSIPVNSRVRKESVPKQVYDCYSNLMKNQHFELSKNSSPDLVLTIYLLNVGEHVSDKLFEHFLYFVRVLRGCYYEHGDEIYRACFSSKENSVAYLPGFNIDECKYLPIICDFLVRYYIPIEFKDENCLNLSLIELMLFDFCNWMKKNQLTYIQVILNKDYRLESKVILIPKSKASPSKHDSAKQKELENNLSNSSEAKKEDNGDYYDDLASEANEEEDEDEEGKEVKPEDLGEDDKK